MRSKLVIAVVGFACVLLACEQIIQLDKFKKCDVEIVCEPDASDAGDASDGGSTDAFTFPDGVSEASSWARWRMDNTAIEVQKGAPDASRTSFVSGDGGELADTVNPLVWSTATTAKPNVTDAASFCAASGHRLPTRIEIATLLDSTQSSAPFITPALVDAVKPYKALWTSSYVRPIGNAGLQFWFADLTSGDMRPSSAANVGVLCVR